MTTTLPTGKLRSSAVPCTTGVTTETLALFKRLCDLTGSEEFMIGGYDRFDISGLAPNGYFAEADFVAMTGQYPAMMRYEWQHPNSYATNVPAASGSAAYGPMRAAIVAQHERGGYINLDDFCGNPTTTGGLRATFSENSYATRSGSPCAAALSGGANDADFVAYCTELATFFNNLLDSQGRKIPVIFRPFHEANLASFWWGGVDRQSDYKLVWQRLVTLLKAAGVTNVLYCWNLMSGETGSGQANADQAFSGWYPGNTYVDVVSLDFYNDAAYSATSSYSMLGTANLANWAAMETIASVAGKPMALAEVGYEFASNNSPDTWERAGEEIRTAYRMASFANVWRPTWGPRSGSVGAQSFARMCAKPYCLTLDRLKFA